MEDINNQVGATEYSSESATTESASPSETQEAASASATEKQEDVLKGIVGAIVGACIGGGCIILVGQLGMVASFSGVVLAICTLKGYELLGGCLTKRGVAISVALMLITPYLANQLGWAIYITQEIPGVSLGEAFSAIPQLVEGGYLENYMSNLGLIYLFTAIGAFGTLRKALRKK